MFDAHAQLNEVDEMQLLSWLADRMRRTTDEGRKARIHSLFQEVQDHSSPLVEIYPDLIAELIRIHDVLPAEGEAVAFPMYTDVWQLPTHVKNILWGGFEEVTDEPVPKKSIVRLAEIIGEPEEVGYPIPGGP